jgi:tetratricopeptide (TPR) repeat protein
MDRGDILHAQELLRRARTIDPDGKEFLWDLTDARVLGELGRFDEAIPVVDRLRKDWPERTAGMEKMRADLVLLTEGPEAARRYLNDLDAAGKYEADARDLKLVSRIVGDEERFRRELDKELQEAESDKPRADLWANAGWAALDATVDVPAARRALEEAVTLDPDHGWAHNGLGWCDLRDGRLDEAEAQFRKAQELQPGHSQPAIGIAAAQIQQGRPADAERLLAQWLDRQESLLAIRWMSVALAEQGRWEEAERFARRAVAMSPSTASLAQLAWVLVAGDRNVEEGAKLAEQAKAELHPYYQGKYQWLSCFPSAEHCLGLAAVKRGQVAEGIAMLEEAAEARPDRDRIREDLERAKALL